MLIRSFRRDEMGRKGRKKKEIRIIGDTKITLDSIDDLTIEVYDESYKKLGRFTLKDLKEKGVL